MAVAVIVMVGRDSTGVGEEFLGEGLESNRGGFPNNLGKDSVRVYLLCREVHSGYCG